MKINGIITRKLDTFEQILNEVSTALPVTEAQLRDDWKLRRSLERDFQILIEVVIDICSRLIAIKKLSPSATGKGSIEKCIQEGILTNSEKYYDMIGFRNFLVHRYEFIDLWILEKTFNESLPLFKQFKNEINSYVSKC